MDVRGRNEHKSSRDLISRSVTAACFNGNSIHSRGNNAVFMNLDLGELIQGPGATKLKARTG